MKIIFLLTSLLVSINSFASPPDFDLPGCSQVEIARQKIFEFRDQQKAQAEYEKYLAFLIQNFNNKLKGSGCSEAQPIEQADADKLPLDVFNQIFLVMDAQYKKAKEVEEARKSRDAKQAEIAKIQADADQKAELWPPTSHEFCSSAAASGDLDRRSVSLSECYKLAEREGKHVISERAKVGGYFVREFELWDVNSAGGVEPHAKFVNPNTEVDIKYIDLQIVMYNAVGDQLRSDIGNKITGLVRMTGPLRNEDGEKSVTWDPIWYNHSAVCLKIQSIRVEFMNKKTLNFSGKSLAKSLHPKLKNECGVRHLR